VNDYTTEDEALDRIRQLWGQYGKVIVILSILVAGSFGGRNLWVSYKSDSAENSSLNYSQLLLAVDQKRFEDAYEIGSEIIKTDAQSSYAELSSLFLAKISFEKGDYDVAKNTLIAVIESSSDLNTGNVARERLARILLSEGKADDSQKVLEESKSMDLANHLLELQGDIMKARGDLKSALSLYQKALAKNIINGQDSNNLSLKLNDIENNLVGTK
jgi:predicted negative regulator of RcsB-dependent stress response|tara:strand:+ start:103 stop:750 length:648 start_codon:yes stop_codon:yes gene_type:complete